MSLDEYETQDEWVAATIRTARDAATSQLRYDLAALRAQVLRMPEPVDRGRVRNCLYCGWNASHAPDCPWLVLRGMAEASR